MAGSGQGGSQKRATTRQGERVVPSLARGSSRVSKAAGGQDTTRSESVRVEQRSNMPSSRQGSRAPATTRGTARGKQSTSSARKSPVSTTRRAPSTRAGNPLNGPRDTQFIQWASNKWSSLEPHHQQRVFSTALLVLSLLLFGSMTVFRSTPILKGINAFFQTFFGWSAYLLALGLVAFALIHLVEDMRKQRLLRLSTVMGMIAIWLLLLLESRLIYGPGPNIGVLAELLIAPLLGWSAAVQHITIIGLLLIVIVMTFRITFGHVLMIAHILERLFADPSSPSLGENKPLVASPFLGQRPQYSRYAAGQTAALNPAGGTKGRQVLARTARRPMDADVEVPEDEDEIDFEADFDVDAEQDDPLNDIALHRDEIGRVPRGNPVVKPLDPEEHTQAVRGVKQKQLEFEPTVVEDTKIIIKQPPDMEPLPPNPRLAAQEKVKAAKPAKPAKAEIEHVISSPWKLPPLTLLNNPDMAKLQMYGDDTASLAKTIQDTLRSFRVDAEVRPEDISIGPTIIRFGIRPTGKPEMRKDEKTGKMVPVVDASGQIVYETRTRVSRIMALQNDLALVLEAKTIRMEAPVPGRPYVGVEIPNKNSRLVTLREVLESKEYQPAKAKSKLAIGLGKDVAGVVRVGDLARMPHLLIAGATGAGKSVMINAIIASILTQATPDDVRLLMVDPKMVELNMYNGIPHLLSPVVIEVDKVVSLLKNAIGEMERRYRLFSQLGVRNLDGYRKLRLEKQAQGDTSLNNLPAIVIIIDELADLMMAAPEEVEGMICRLAQLARATGIHLVVATQRPSVDVITGLIKANIPTRISFMVSSAVDSRTIIDMGGAERLLGRGDMLYLPADAGRPERIQGSFLADEEAQTLAEYWREQAATYAAAVGDDPASPKAEPGWELKAEAVDEEEQDDDLLEKAEDIVHESGKASISLLQRRLRISYSRAARLIELLEEHGTIGRSDNHSRARDAYDHGGSDGHSMTDEVADIVAEEKARNDFLRKQAAQLQQGHTGAQHKHRDDDEEQ